jgi:uncharacterized protein YyaL (SSP411 family)
MYAEAALATGEAAFAETANQTANWMLADMQDENGGLYSTRDADSEGEEGLYYLWTPGQVEQLIGDDYNVFASRFGLDKDPNFEGQWHLTVREPIADDDASAAIERGRKILLEERMTRIAPSRDEKQLTSWNALAIRGLAIAGRSLDRPELTDAAIRAVDFIINNLIVGGRLLANFKDGKARFPAYLDDHAFLLDALLELLQSRWNTGHLEFAVQLANLMIEHFEDRENGSFFFTANDHETLMHRPKSLADEAVPSGNGIAAFGLQRLARGVFESPADHHHSWRNRGDCPLARFCSKGLRTPANDLRYRLRRVQPARCVGGSKTVRR